MKICNCSLAGTDACRTCSSYPYSYHIVNDLIDSRKTIPEHSAWFRIGEVLVDESKGNITPEQAIRKIKEYMRMMEKPERKENDWIPCSERLPDKSGEYLVTDYGWPTTTVDVVEFFCKNGVSEWVSYDHVVAWMPVPEPYRGEQDD